MHAKRTLFDYGKIFVITRPIPSTIPIPALYSQPSCLTLQPMTPLTILNLPTSSKRVLNRRGTQTQVSPSPSPSPSFPSRFIDKTRLIPLLVLTPSVVPPLGLTPSPAKRGRGRPKGSKNKKITADPPASTSEVAPSAGEKRKRGRPPKACSPELLPPLTPPQHPSI